MCLRRMRRRRYDLDPRSVHLRLMHGDVVGTEVAPSRYTVSRCLRRAFLLVCVGCSSSLALILSIPQIALSASGSYT